MRVSIVFGLILLAACSSDRPETSDCESRILGKIKSPSSYKRISATSVATPHGAGQRNSVLIEYDAQNTYGALIREKMLCFYPLIGNVADIANYSDTESESLDELERQADIGPR